MKYTWIVLVGLLFMAQGFTQDQKCDRELFDAVFEGLHQKTKDTLVIRVGYAPSRDVLDNLKATGLVTLKEHRMIELAIDKEYEPCQGLVDLLTNIKENSPSATKANGSYVKRHFSRPIYMSETKACIFSTTSVASKKYEGGKAIGGEYISIYTKGNGKWHFDSRQSLAMY
ncbi:hypothetical protein WIW50_20680 [Flavobacteriaceae bacterium 3-367]